MTMVASFTEKHQLPVSFSQMTVPYYIEAAKALHRQFSQQGAPYFVGINGCQGSGKSTFADFICEYLTATYRLNVVVLSLDDFYYSQEQRKSLATRVHPLLATRGVPGTHDIELLTTTLTNLMQRKTGFSVPKFDKSTDNPCPNNVWQNINEPVDIVLFEGWCWGTEPQSKTELTHPINDLEAQHDKTSVWRSFVNSQLEHHLKPLYKFMHYWLVLQAPSFSCVHQWRLEQEQKLAKKMKLQMQSANMNTLMNSVQISTFIQHFQRLTEHGIKTLHQKADLVFFLDEQRSIHHMDFK